VIFVLQIIFVVIVVLAHENIIGDSKYGHHAEFESTSSQHVLGGFILFRTTIASLTTPSTCRL